jgi:hypothetical protein
MADQPQVHGDDREALAFDAGEHLGEELALDTRRV